MLRRLDSEPWQLPAKFLKNRLNQNLRCDANNRVVRLVRRIYDKYIHDGPNVVRLWESSKRRNILAMYYRYELGMLIENHVFLAYHLYSLSLLDEARGSPKYFLLLPRIWWAELLSSDLAGLSLCCVCCERTYWSRDAVLRLIRRLTFGRRTLYAPGENDDFLKPPAIDTALKEAGAASYETKAAASIWDGFNPNARNNVEWMWSGRTSPGRLVCLWDNPYVRAGDSDERFAREHDVTFLRSRRLHSGLEERIPSWRSGGSYYRIFLRTLFTVSRLIPQALLPGTAPLRWQILTFLFVLRGMAWWQDLFQANNIKVYVEDMSSTDIYMRALAMEAAGGYVLLTQRSQQYDNHRYPLDRPGDVFLMSGAHGVRQSVTPASDMASIVITGMPGSTLGASRFADYMQAVKGHLSLSKAKLLIFDEPGVIHGKENISLFIRAFIQDVMDRDDYQIIFKPKSKNTFRSLKADLIKEILGLRNDNKVVLLDPKWDATTAARLADVAVTVPSTAMLECIAVGTRTVVYNPYRTIRRLFYEHGLLNQSIYEDLDTLLRDLHSYLAGQNPSMGRCDDIRSIIDPFKDGKGSERIGFLIQTLLELIERYSANNVILETATRIYNEKWGEELAGKGSEIAAKLIREHPTILWHQLVFEK